MRRRIATFIPLILVLAASGCGRGSLFDYLSNPVRPPFANPASGIYNNPVQVWFNPSTRDDRLVIYYTLDPDLPIGDLGAWNQYDYMNGNGIPVAVGEPTTIRVFSYISELEFSDVEAYQYSFRPQPPGFWPLPGNYSSATSIYLNAFPGTRVFYTLDDSDPSTSVTAVEWTSASPPIGLGDGTDPDHPTSRHVRAISRSTVHAAWLDSTVAEGYYTYLAPGSDAMGMSVTLPNGTVVGFNGIVPALDLNVQDITVTSNPVSPLVGPFTYAWILNAAPLAVTGNSVVLGANGPAGLSPLDLGVYRIICVLTDGAGVQRSSSLYFTVVHVTIAQTGLDITLALPEAATVNIGNVAYLDFGTDYTFSAALTGATAPISSCEWFLNGVSQAIAPSLALSGLAIGNYELSCVVTAGGFEYSRTILLYVVNR
jgi:hypothetical protein